MPSYLVELGGVFPLRSGGAEDGLLHHHVLGAAIACVSLGSTRSSLAGRMKKVTRVVGESCRCWLLLDVGFCGQKGEYF